MAFLVVSSDLVALYMRFNPMLTAAGTVHKCPNLAAARICASIPLVRLRGLMFLTLEIRFVS